MGRETLINEDLSSNLFICDFCRSTFVLIFTRLSPIVSSRQTFVEEEVRTLLDL